MTPGLPPPGASGRRAGAFAGAFMGSAASRLLPPSVPFRYFGAAVVFHVFAWLALLAGASDWPHWHGGLGWPLAALHLITLGTLLTSAIGASLQLLPVATRQPVRRQRLAGVLWWAYVPGTAVLALGMGLARPALLGLGAVVVVGALVLYGLLLVGNLRGARGMPGVVLHGWGALGSLVLLALTALSLVALWLGHPVLGRDTARTLHLLAGAFGFMGLLVLGLSYILVPMFALSGVPDERAQLGSGATALLALALAAVAAFEVAPTGLRLAALGAGAASLMLHLRLMRAAITTGMRRDLGRSLTLMRIGWAALWVAFGVAAAKLLAEWQGTRVDVLGRIFVLLVVIGWLLSFLFAVLQRILPFLASMHAAKGRHRPPTPSALTLQWPLGWHFAGHCAALVLLAAAGLLQSYWLTVAAAVSGSVGALAFAAFFAALVSRLRRARADGTRTAPKN